MAGTRCSVLTPTTMLWVCWPGEISSSPLHPDFVLCAQGGPTQCLWSWTRGACHQGTAKQTGKSWERTVPRISHLPMGPEALALWWGQTRALAAYPGRGLPPSAQDPGLSFGLLGRCAVSLQGCVPLLRSIYSRCSAHGSYAGIFLPWHFLWR